ncbi:RagB/SusD family nutrient uptake outer membrane protein [Pedobacter chinensis]|uniref:RagB/SusD family nutrient uptake outer membrane protein n=1 Tax=Pedobacter chinensis TaxID=2282421 RepID=A0A369PYP0_9SPHI|nr:RagB/SusD family nutrient uptake outer membrane protein [Pedobacter chinensis]RDC57594.1 RagB/SusD family nutrient uptake outer membrane protein [Pedobacter chinensis]
MKTLNKYVCLLIIICLVTACKKDFLDKKPQDLIPDDVAYGSESGLAALTVTLYNDINTEDFNYQIGSEGGFPSTVTDEALRSYPWGAPNDPVVGNWFGDWDYGRIRRVNDFLEKIDNAKVTDDIKKRYKAEAHFIRAFHYFNLVKRYGGVPLITTVQQFTGDNISQLQVQRNKEQEIYDFIDKELALAIADLPEISVEQGRINKYGALALESRAMLYAASSAKYATLQLNGLVGIPASLANTYWQKSLDAAKTIIDQGMYHLYDSNPNKAANFQQLFLTPGNAEAIFTKYFKAPAVSHAFDFYNAPQSFKVDYGCVTNPTLEMVEEFEYRDGSPGKLKVYDNVGNPIVYNRPQDLFANKDPRMFATILTPFDSWQGGIVEIRKGVIDGGYKTTEDLWQGYPTNDNSFKIVGKDGPIAGSNDPTKTGFYIKKFMDPNNRLDWGLSQTPWMVFRYGEVLLNYAEAAIELGQIGEALNAINQIRDRAGIATLGSVTRDIVRHERKVELAFENHRIWDIRRWRIASTILNNTQFHALYPWIIWQNGVDPSQMKYSFTIVVAPKNSRTFPERLYYEPVPQGNPTYVQNPLY